MPAETPEPGPRAKKTIFIVDDHPVLRRGLASLIETVPGLAVCGAAATAQAALEALSERQPDLLIVDLALEGSDGLRPGVAREMFRGRYDLSPTGHQHFDVSKDQRFAAIALDQAEDPESLHLIVNWDHDLDHLVSDLR